MGSMSRRLDQLESIGINDEDTRKKLMFAIEGLNSAGDDFSNALWDWLNEGTPATAESASQELSLVLGSITHQVELIQRHLQEATNVTDGW